MKLLNRLRAMYNREEELEDAMLSQYNFGIDSEEYGRESDVEILDEYLYLPGIDEEVSLSNAELIKLAEEIDANSY
ncbi:MAG: hypothetical protein ACMZ63_02535 [Methylotenera sp.]